MKTLPASWIIAALLLFFTATANAEYTGYTAFSIDSRDIEFKALGEKADANLMQIGLKAGMPVAPFVTLEARYTHGVNSKTYGDTVKLSLDHTAAALVLFGSTAAQQGYFKPYIGAGWAETKAKLRGTAFGFDIAGSKTHQAPIFVVGATLYGSRPDEFSSIWGTRPAVGINLEYAQLIDEQIKVSGIPVKTSLSGISLSIVKRW